MAKRMMCVWLAGLGLVAAALAQDAAPKPTKEQIQAARKRMQKAIGVVAAMTRPLYQKDEELKALRQKSAETAKTRDDAIRKILAADPETKELADKEATVSADLQKVQKELAALQAKRVELYKQLRELQKPLRKPWGKARRDKSVVPLSKAASEADKGAKDAARAKLVTTPEGKKAVEDMDAARKAYYELVPQKKRAPRKPRGKRGKPKKAKDAGAGQ